MSTRNPGGVSSASGASTGPSNAARDSAKQRNTRCVTGVRFLINKHGMWNIIAFIAIICVLIGAGTVDPTDARNADRLYPKSNVKISALQTRSAVIVFAVFGLVLILFDTLLYVTGLIYRFSARFDIIFISVMFVFATIYFILGCCAGAWEKKLNDTLGTVKHKGAAAAASAFLFITTIAIIAGFLSRLLSPATHDEE